MTLLEVITKAVANHELPGSQLEHPIILNPDNIFLNLKPELEGASAASLVNPVSGWQISEVDTYLIDSGKKFHAKLKRKLKDTNNFDKDEFIGILNPYLQKIGEKVGISTRINRSDSGYTQGLIEKVGFLMGRDVASLVLEACISLRIWELVETLIVHGLVDHSSYSNLVTRLATEKRSDLLCLCVKYSPDLGSSELLCILKYFLCPPKDAYGSMGSVRMEWESQALLAIEKAGPCPEASFGLGLKACDWVPKLEVIVQCLGLVLDENFSSLVLLPEFQEELRSIEGVVSTLASEARYCCSLANVVKRFGS
ncbi:hypothetical protein CISIN_1g016426mg [Citrus sinensis]|uniref:Uncharacterized protein n=1 Tax=Citrus sinensis TaxID=2711 RepID=A0A067G8S0_CITSI|nr:hypothetical protein CISIN_1g016426mg [Citrus sinensis]